jgi:hypothetical protein
MKIVSRLGVLAVLCLAAIAAITTAALATNSTPTGGSTTTACTTPTDVTGSTPTTASTTGDRHGTCPTLTPAGNFTGTGTSMLNPDTLTITIDCTTVTVTGSAQEDGTGTISVSFSSCQTLIPPCTVGAVNAPVTAKATGAAGGTLITVDGSPTARISCGNGLTCTIVITPTPTPAGDTFAHLLIDGTTHRTVTLTGRVRSRTGVAGTDPAGDCAGVLSGSGQLTSGTILTF